MQPVTLSKQRIVDTLKLSKLFLRILSLLLKQVEHRRIGLLRFFGISLPLRRQAKNLVPVRIRCN